MDDTYLQQKEAELKRIENDLDVRESDLTNRETRMHLGLDLSINTQEFLRRAIEVGSNALQKLDSVNTEIEDYVFTHLEELIDTAAVKLKEELKKLK